MRLKTATSVSGLTMYTSADLVLEPTAYTGTVSVIGRMGVAPLAQHHQLLPLSNTHPVDVS
jgi:hypothetical protein